MAGLLAAAVTAGCGRSEPGVIDVTVRVSVCVVNGTQCFGLSVIEADVAITTVGGVKVASGKTDEAGKASFTVDHFGDLLVVVRSPLLEKPELTSTAQLSPGGGTSVSFLGPMSPALITAAGPWTTGST